MPALSGSSYKFYFNILSYITSFITYLDDIRILFVKEYKISKESRCSAGHAYVSVVYTTIALVP